MSVQKMWEIALNIALIPILAATIVVMVKKTEKHRDLFSAFFIFAMVAAALEDVYWIAYDFLRPDTWMPFAADEIAGSAIILLLGSALSTRVDKGVKAKIPEVIFNILFLGGCTYLWIAWSGEWIQDIVFTLPYMYYLYVLLRGMRSTKALTKTETFFAVVICAAVVITDVISLYMSEAAVAPLVNVNYMLLNVTMLYLYAKTIRLRKTDPPETTLFRSFCLYFWGRLVIYLTSGLFYNIALFLCIPAILLMLGCVIAVREDEK